MMKHPCYRQGKNRFKCDTCEAETPIAKKRCYFWDPRKIPPRGEYVCESCGKTYRNWMSSMRHNINCESVFIHNLSKILCNADGSPIAINTSALISKKPITENR